MGNLIHSIDILNQVAAPPPSASHVGAPKASTPAPVVKPKLEINSEFQDQIEIEAAYLRCMIDDNSGLLKFNQGTTEKLCYFELSDLNIEKPYQLLDIVMLLNRYVRYVIFTILLCLLHFL